MNTKPKILAKPKRITALEKRKQPLSWYERNEVDAWYHRRAISDEARRLFDENEKFLLEEKRRKKREKREQKERADREHRERVQREKFEKKQDRLEIAHDFIMSQAKKDVSRFSSSKIKSLSRMIGSTIRDTRPTVFVGWESTKYLAAVQQAKAAGKNKPNPTKDHIYPQQFFGRFLITHLMVFGTMTREQFDRYMEVFNQVSHITFKENNVLGIQGGEDAPQHARKFLNPERAYREGGVEVDFEKYPPIKRLEDVAPREVLQAHFGERFEEMHKYKC